MTAAVVEDSRTVDAAVSWFAKFGGTDVAYLRSSWDRYMLTRDFIGQLRAGSNVLDVGSHWLHQAYVYADEGHNLICVDAPNTLSMPSVIAAAQAMRAQLLITRRLDIAAELGGLEESTVDLVLFTEVIEHLAFNPIDLWRAIYRVLRPEGRIIVSTPNSMNQGRLSSRLLAMISAGEYGLELDSIFDTGTYGHHWREFSIPELKRYFLRLSGDFEVTRSFASADSTTQHGLQFEMPEKLARFINKELFDELDRIGCETRGDQILLEVTLRKKSEGININPPWRV